VLSASCPIERGWVHFFLYQFSYLGPGMMLLQPWFDLVGECGNEADHGLPMGPVSCQCVMCRVSDVGCRVSVVFPVSGVQHLVRVSSSRVEPPVASHARPRLGKAIGEMARFCQRPARRRFDRCFGAFAKQFACQTRRPRPGLGCRRRGAAMAGIRLAAPESESGSVSPNRR
jgi:hypothetical protein